jgi:hypothetical protein
MRARTICLVVYAMQRNILQRLPSYSPRAWRAIVIAVPKDKLLELWRQAVARVKTDRPAMPSFLNVRPLFFGPWTRGVIEAWSQGRLRKALPILVLVSLLARALASNTFWQCTSFSYVLLPKTPKPHDLRDRILFSEWLKQGNSSNVNTTPIS